MVAAGQPHPLADFRIRLRRRTRAVRRRRGNRLDAAPRHRAQHRGRCARFRFRDHPRALRRAAGQGRGGRYAARRHRHTPGRGCRIPGRAPQSGRAQGQGDAVHRPRRRAVASSRLARRAGRSAVEGKPRCGGAAARRLAAVLCRRRRPARSHVRQRHAVDRRRADGRGRCAEPAAFRTRAADALARFRYRCVERAAGGSARTRHARPRRVAALHPRQRPGSARDQDRARKRAGGRGRNRHRFRGTRYRRVANDGEPARRGRVQPALRRAPRRRSGPVPRAWGCVETHGTGLERGIAVRRFRTGARDRPAREQALPAVQRPDRVQPDRLRSGRAADARILDATRTVGWREDGREPPAQEPRQVETLAAAGRRGMFPRLRRRHSRIRLRGRRVHDHRWRGLAARAGIRRAGGDPRSDHAQAAERTAVRGARGVRRVEGSRRGEDAQHRQGRFQVRQPRQSGRIPRRRGRCGQTQGQPVRLPRHRPVPRSSASARTHGAGGARQAFPQPVLLHRRGHGAGGSTGRDGNDQRGSVRDLPRMAGGQFARERHRRHAPPHRPGRRAALDRIGS